MAASVACYHSPSQPVGKLSAAFRAEFGLFWNFMALPCSTKRVSGLIGKLSFEHEKRCAAILEGMLDAVRHRGAGSGPVSAPGIALWCWAIEHVRHGVLSSRPRAGDCSRHRRRSLTNAAELRSQLECRGHGFAGQRRRADRARLEEWGDRASNGSAAPSRWLCGPAAHTPSGRDHLGIRPLTFALLPGHGVVFASEIRALLHDPGVGRECCPAAIDAYLALGYIPSPLTAYQRVSKLEPAQRLIVEGRRFHVEQYWDLPHPTAAANELEIVRELDHRLRTAIRTNLKDARVSATLFSGGAASGALLPDAAAAVPTVVITALEQDTRDVARSHAAATHLGGDPRVEVATPTFPSSRASGPLISMSRSRTRCDTQYAACVAARSHTDHALAGHGAAASGGFPRHLVEHVEALMRTGWGRRWPRRRPREIRSRLCQGGRALSASGVAAR